MSDPNGWVPIGPSVIPKGQLGDVRVQDGPVSGRCTALAVDPTPGAQTIYAGTAMGGIWKSTDNGATWISKTDFEACLGIGCITIDATNTQRVYAGTGEANEGTQIAQGVGVLKSDDRGETWTLRGMAALAGRQLGHIVVDPTSPSVLFAGTTHGLFQSPDAGITWNPVETPVDDPWITGLHLDTSDPANRRLYVAIGRDGVYRRDGAGPFVKLNNNAPTAGVYRIALAVSPSNPQIVYAAFGRNEDHQFDVAGIWRSNNRGDRWEPVAPLPLPPKQRTAQSHYNLVLSVHPTDPDRVFFGEVRLWRSTNGGREWELVSEAHEGSVGLHSDHHALVFDPRQPDRVWSGNDGGVFLSVDGGTNWAHRNRGLQTLQYYALAVHPSHESLVIAGSQDNGLNRFLGHPAWERVRGGDGFYCAIDPVEPTHWYGGAIFRKEGLNGPFSSAVFESTAAGSNGSFDDIADNAWIADYPPTDFPPFLPIAHSPTESSVVYIGTTRLYRRRGFTIRWETVTLRGSLEPFTTAVTEGGVTSSTPAETITAIAISRSNPAIVYVGTADGRCFRLERGTDGLYTAADRTDGLPTLVSSELISDIAINPADPDRVFVAIGNVHGLWSSLQQILSGRIFFSSDGGQNWQARGSNQLNVTAGGTVVDHRMNAVNAVVIDPDHPTHVYIGCDIGLFRSTDEGANWTAWHENLPNTLISDLQIHQPTRIIRAATHGRGVWERRLDSVATAAAVDLFIRDNRVDVARRPTREREADPIKPSAELVWNSSLDVKVDAPTFLRRRYQSAASTIDYSDAGAIDFLGFELLGHDDPREADDARVYVQVQNRGPDVATNVKVRVYSSHKLNGSYPDLPTDFWNAFPDGDHSHPVFWRPIGPAVTIPQIRPAEPGVATWTWTVPNSPTSTIGLLAVVTNAQDPANENRRVVEDVVRANKHAALREISVGTPRSAIFALVLVAVGVAALATYEVATA